MYVYSSSRFYMVLNDASCASYSKPYSYSMFLKRTLSHRFSISISEKGSRHNNHNGAYLTDTTHICSALKGVQRAHTMTSQNVPRAVSHVICVLAALSSTYSGKPQAAFILVNSFKFLEFELRS